MSHFKSWVPNSLAKIILFALLIPNMVMFFLPVANEEVTAGYYGIEPNDVQFTISLYYVGFAAFYCLERRFYNYFSAKHYFILFQIFQLCCCYVLFTVQIPLLVFIIRFIQGMLFASAVNLYLSIAGQYMKTTRAKEISYSLFFGMLLCTGSFNNLITADIIDQYNFDTVFKAALFMFACSLVVVLICIAPNTEFTKHKLIKLDVESFILLAFALTSIGYLSVYGQQYYWFNSKRILGISLLAFFSVALFIYRQLHLKRPYIDIKIFKEKNYWWGILLLFFMYIERFSFAYVGNFYKQVLGMDPRHVSYMFVYNIIGIIAGVSLAAWHQIKKQNVIWLWICGFSSLMIYHIMMTQMLHTAGNEWNYIIPLFLHGLGIGIIMVPAILFAISSVPYYLTPSAAAFCLIIRFMGYTTSTALTKYFTVHNYNLHYQRFSEYINADNSFYFDKIDAIKQFLKNNGVDQKQLAITSQKVFKTRLDNQILLRSIMDYYSLMIYLSFAVLLLLIAYYLKVKQIHTKFRPLMPI